MPGTIPHKLRIGFRDYVIQPMQPHERGNNEDYLGLHYGQRGIITINFTCDPPYPDIELVSTIMHELFHAVLSIQAHSLTEQQEEQVVEGITCGFMQVCRDNPHLLTWLHEMTYDPDTQIPEDGLQEPSRIQCLPVPNETRGEVQVRNRV